MLIGWVSGLRSERLRIHSPSAHSWPSSEATIEQLPGRSCMAKPYGSALRMLRPLRVRSSYLYSVPGPTPGMNSSQIPDAPRVCMACRRPSQRLNGPTTLTRPAFGAHTAKRVPSSPSRVAGCAPSL